MAGKKVVRIVAHPKLYMSVGGILEHVPAGTKVTVTEEQCKAFGKKLADPAEQKKLDTTTKGGALSEGDATESEEVKRLTAELEASQAETEKVKADAKEALAKQGASLKASQAETVAAKAETVKANEALTAAGTQLGAAEQAVKKLKADAAKPKK